MIIFSTQMRKLKLRGNLPKSTQGRMVHPEKAIIKWENPSFQYHFFRPV